jgi:hypothetical protein
VFVQATADLVQVEDHVLQRLALPAQVLGTLGVVPDAGVFQQADDFV